MAIWGCLRDVLANAREHPTWVRGCAPSRHSGGEGSCLEFWPLAGKGPETRDLRPGQGLGKWVGVVSLMRWQSLGSAAGSLSDFLRESGIWTDEKASDAPKAFEEKKRLLEPMQTRDSGIQRSITSNDIPADFLGADAQNGRAGPSFSDGA